MRIFIFILLVILGTSCDPYDNRLTIVNDSNDTIYFVLSDDLRLKSHPIWISQSDTLWTHTNFIKPFQQVKMAKLGRNGWDKYINESCNDSTIHIFFFQRSILNQKNQNDLVTKQLWSLKKSYKLKEIEELEWKIRFP